LQAKPGFRLGCAALPSGCVSSLLELSRPSIRYPETKRMTNGQPILITGTTGQVGAALLQTLRPLGTLHAPTRATLDLADPASIRACVQAIKPRWIVNPAAYTAVDKAESEPELAHAINAIAPGILGEEAAKIGATVLHFSTDYVFDGSGTRPYKEDDPTGPLGVYGRTKLAGEQALAATGAAHIILRTSWVYSATGKNFLLTMLRLAKERPELKIVADQHGTPTSAPDLAALAAHILCLPEPRSGIYHATNSGETTWHGFATEILRLAGSQTPVLPIATTDFPTPARRPANSRLNCDQLASTLNYRLPNWQASLAQLLATLAPSA
jgi:dTDP-4-dehydrorhamnose reductase